MECNGDLPFSRLISCIVMAAVEHLCYFHTWDELGGWGYSHAANSW